MVKKKKEEAVTDDLVAAADNLAIDWVGDMLAKVKGTLGTLPPQTQGHVRVAITYLEEHSADIVGLGKRGFLELLNLVSVGAQNEAREHYIRTQLGPDGLIALMTANTEEMGTAYAKAKQAEAQFWAFIYGVGALGLRLLRAIIVKE